MDHLFGPESQTIVRAMKLVALALFVAAGAPLLARRRHLRRAAVIVYGAALAVVVVAIAFWLAGGNVGRH